MRPPLQKAFWFVLFYAGGLLVVGLVAMVIRAFLAQ